MHGFPVDFLGPLAKQEGHFLDVLRRSGQICLFLDRPVPASPGVSKTMQFFRIGETPFNRLAAQAIQFFSADSIGVDPNLFLMRLPNMSRDRPLCRVRGKTVGT